MEKCVANRPPYWDEMGNTQKLEVLRREIVILIEEVEKLNKLLRHTHSMSGRIVYEENDEFSLSLPSWPPNRLPIELQKKPNKEEI